MRNVLVFRFTFINFRRISSKIYDKPDDFDFDTVNYPFVDGDVPRTMLFTFLNLFALQGCLDI